MAPAREALGAYAAAGALAAGRAMNVDMALREAEAWLDTLRRSATAMTVTYQFGRVEVRPATRQLLVDGQPAALGARAFDLLLALIEHRDRLVAKNELLELVWPGLIIEENNLQVQVSALRKLLGQDAIATVAGRGYRSRSNRRSRGAALQAVSLVAKHNLPAQVSSFIGRERELLDLRAMLTKYRLVTLTVSAGSARRAWRWRSRPAWPRVCRRRLVRRPRAGFGSGVVAGRGRLRARSQGRARPAGRGDTATVRRGPGAPARPRQL